MLSRMGAAVVAEAVGTFLSSSSASAPSWPLAPTSSGVALAHGLALAVLVSALAPFRAAHFNPAVTVAVRLSGGIGWGPQSSTSWLSWLVRWRPASPSRQSFPESV